ncbi:MAG: maltodextrin glucosidase [Candidatus Riflebacteria bacterium]|nr:maltodextrin glucosidase [Candidatus Riflebacteria bacterium]
MTARGGKNTLPPPGGAVYPSSPPDLPPYARSIHHDGSARYVITRNGHEPELGESAEIRLRAALSASIDRVFLRSCPDGEQTIVPMQPEPPSAACRWWRATLPLSMPTMSYRFLLFTADGPFWYNARGLARHLPTDAEDFRLLTDYLAPRWVDETVFYQIFPDRFADGSPETNVKDGEFVYRGATARTRRWGDPPTAGQPDSMVEFYGGDLVGVEQKLDYLQELGVNALFFNPIFTALTNHRYDSTDYLNVDPHLGGNEALASLRKATAQRGIRFILDIVPNHCGVEHPWFKAAQADLNASTNQYFTFTRHPEEYLCWLGQGSLPKLNYRSAALRRAMYESPEAIFRHWLREPYSADGWRIDVANMLARQGANQLGLEVGHGIRWAVKEERPDAYILGENFFDGTSQLQGTCWDATMNYSGFAMPLWWWLGRFNVRQHTAPHLVESTTPWSTVALAESLDAYRAAIPWMIARQQFNLLGSHDTARIASVVGGDVGLARLAVGVLMTYVGVPCVYYGDEVGLAGPSADEGRCCMPWEPESWDRELREFYRQLICLRKTSPALIRGGFQTLLAEQDTLAYLRDADDDLVIVVAHRGPDSRPAGALPVWHGAIPDNVEFREVATGVQTMTADGNLPLPSLRRGITIWRARPGEPPRP